ncbi:hypothetical protein OPQ81_004973 [Rhizoctonia solani]|nr:hypothetical protein OPQ81_004973 [Rhizoctonia solani]
MASNTYNNTTSTNTHNTHNPFTGDGTGPHPPPGTNPMTGRTKDGNLGRNEQQPPEAPHTGTIGTGPGVTSGTNTHNTHNPLTGDGATNTHNPLTGDKTGPHPPSGTNPVTGRTRDDNLGRHEQQPAGYTDTTGMHTGMHTGGHAGAGTGITSGTNTHNTHNPLTGDGVSNTHNPLTGDKTGPHPSSGIDPATGRTNDGNLGRREQHPVGHTGATGIHTGATGTHTTGGVTSGTNTHNTHNPLTGDGVTNTHNPLTGDKTGTHPPPGTNPVTGRTNDGNLGRHEQHPAGYTGTTGTTGTDAHTIHDTTRGAHNTGGIGTTGAGAGGHPTSTQTSGGGAKALVGKVEATLGSIIKNPEMHAKGVQKQEEAQAAKLAKQQEGAHGGAEIRH